MAAMGRPRTFDRDKAVEDAMHLFWQHGYESTSLAQLKAGINKGISAPSFYAAFGSKEALFRECVQRYLATHGQVSEFLWDNRLSPHEAVETTLRASAKMQCDPSHPPGCMVTLGTMSATSAEHAKVTEPLARSRNRTSEGIMAAFQRAVASGEIKNDTDISALAALFTTFLFGMSIQARDGVSLDRLNSAITQLMTLWDASA